MQTKTLLTTIIAFLFSFATQAQNHNPYKDIGKKGKVLTLTNGKYEEFFDEDSIQRIGTALININTMKVVKLQLTEDEQRIMNNSANSRFLSIDPYSGKYPELTPYQYASNRPIDGIDLDGLEYYSAANWAQNNIADYTIKFNYDYQAPPTFKTLRQTNWKEIIGKTMYCATSTALSYAQANPKVAKALQNTGFKSNRGLQLDYFIKGNSYASLIKPKDFTKADRGDLIFLQNPSKPGQSGEGHVAILATTTRDKGDGTFTVNVYSTNAGNSNNPDRQGTFGEAIYLFQKNDKGETQLVTKFWFDSDNKVYRSVDMRGENLILQGFGRVDERKIDNDTNSKPVKDDTKKTTE